MAAAVLSVVASKVTQNMRTRYRAGGTAFSVVVRLASRLSTSAANAATTAGSRHSGVMACL
jgi:hypothetical protein